MQEVIMARIRTVKPEFWTSEQIANCSRNARLLFIGMWTFCDDAGIHPASTKRLKMQVFPADVISDEEISGWITELLCQKLIEEYSVEDQSYWRVTGWRHQLIKKPCYKYPTDTPPVPHQSTTKIETVRHELVSPPIPVHPVNRNRDINIDREKICPLADTAQPEILEVFAYWQSVMIHPKAKLDKTRERAIEKALREYSLEELRQAIDGCSKSDFHMGQNPEGQRHDAISLIVRDAEHIERFIAINNKQNSIFDGVI